MSVLRPPVEVVRQTPEAAMPKAKPELPVEHLTTLNRVIASCAETAALCQKCASCGIDVDKEALRNAEQLKFAQKLKAEFFPNAR